MIPENADRIPNMQLKIFCIYIYIITLLRTKVKKFMVLGAINVQGKRAQAVESCLKWYIAKTYRKVFEDDGKVVSIWDEVEGILGI